MKRQRGGSRKGYTIKRKPQTDGRHSYYIPVPTHIGDIVSPAVVFRFELVEEGILLRRVEDKVPAWVRA